MSVATSETRRLSVVVQAEQAVLSAMLNDHAAIAKGRRILHASDFSNEHHEKLYRAILAVVDRGGIVDPLTFADELAHRGQFETDDDRNLIGFLVDAAPTTTNVEHHANIVVEAAQERELVQCLRKAIQDAESGRCRAPEIVARIIPALETIRPVTSRVKLVDDLAVEQLPPLEYLVDGLLPVESLIAVYGPPASGKSFTVLDLACCVATGEPWLGHPIRRRGPVVYVAAEGAAGLQRRLYAWKEARRYVGHAIGVQFVLEALNLLEEGDSAALLARIHQLAESPALVVFDTLHRSMPGGDENSAKDVGLVIERVDRIRRATRAAVLLVHHSRKDSEVERGSTSLRGAVDTLIQIKPGDDAITLSCEKQKDGPAFNPILLSLTPAAGSCVIELQSYRDSSRVRAITPQQRQALTVLSRDFLSDGASATNWLKASGIPDASFYRVRSSLVREGYVEERPVGRYKRYVISPSGQSAIAINYQPLSSELSGAGLTYSHNSRSPVGARVDESRGAEPDWTQDAYEVGTP